MTWTAFLLAELPSSQSLWILSMPNTEAPTRSSPLTVQSKKQKHEGTFHCTCLSTEASSEASPPTTVIVLAVLLTPTTLLESCQCQPVSAVSELAKSLVFC